MSETTLFDDGWVAIEFNEDLYPRDALHGAAYVFIDRAYVHLERAGEARFRVRIKAKGDRPEDTHRLAGDFENEILAQTYRRRLAAENRGYIEAITARGIAGAAGPPGLDDLLAMEIGEATAFDDPLGIAMSWEEKFAKKKPEAQAGEDAAEKKAD